MKALWIARRDLAAYFNGWWGWVVITIILMLDGLFFNVLAMVEDARMSHEILEQFFYNTGGIHIVAAMLLTMTSFSQEQHSGGENLLATSPVTDGQIVLGKWLAAFGMLALITALTIYMPLLIFVNGKVSVGHIVVGYLGLLLLGSATISIGLFASSLARSQVVAAILGVLVMVPLLLLWAVARAVDPPFNEFLAAMALHHENFRPFMVGILQLGSVVYYVAVTYFFLLAATKTLEARRWR